MHYKCAKKALKCEVIMKKGKFIEQTLGPLLYPYGFEYSTNTGIWEFKRVLTHEDSREIYQAIYVQRHRFTSALFFRIRTTVYGRHEKDVQGFDPEYKGVVYFPYSNDEEFVKLIYLFAEMTRDYAIPYLEQTKEPTLSVTERPSEADQRYLFENREALSQMFAQSQGIDLTIDGSALSELYYQLAVANIGKPYSETKEIMLRMAGFLGMWWETNCDCVWSFNELNGTTYVGGGSPVLWRNFLMFDWAGRDKPESEIKAFFHREIEKWG